MKIVLPKIEHLSMLIMLILFFLPWTSLGPLKRTGMDICLSVIKNGGTIDAYLILATFVFVLLALLLALTKSSGSLLATLATTAPIVAFIYAFFQAKGNYLASVETAYFLVILLSIFVHLKRLGIVTFQK